MRAFDVTVGTTHVPGAAGSEVLSALVKAVGVKLRRILPPRLQQIVEEGRDALILVLATAMIYGDGPVD